MEPPCSDDLLEGLTEQQEALGRPGVGARLVRVLSREHEPLPDLDQQSGDGGCIQALGGLRRISEGGDEAGSRSIRTSNGQRLPATSNVWQDLTVSEGELTALTARWAGEESWRPHWIALENCYAWTSITPMRKHELELWLTRPVVTDDLRAPMACSWQQAVLSDFLRAPFFARDLAFFQVLNGARR